MEIAAIYKEYYIREWTSDRISRIDRNSVPGVFTLWGFKIISCPRLNDPVTVKEEIENILRRQKIFIDSYFALLRNPTQFDTSVELRAIKHPENKSIDLLLVFRVFTPKEFSKQEIYDSIRHILPGDYEYEPLVVKRNGVVEDNLTSLLELQDDEKVVNVRKRLNWLPVGNISAPRHLERVAPLWDNETFIKETRGKEMSVPHLVPGVDSLIWNDNNWLSLWRIMQESETRLKLRVSLSSIKVFSYEKALMNQAMSLIRHTYRNYDKDIYGTYIKSLSKFAHSESLFSYQVQVASTDQTMSSSLANAFCGEVSYGKRSQLACFEVSSKEMDAMKKDWELCRHTYSDELFELGDIKYPDKLNGILLRAPFIISEAEAATLFRLPVAGIEGLPGIYARPPKPFYQPSSPLLNNDYLSRNQEQRQEYEKKLNQEELQEAAEKTGIRIGKVIVNNQPTEYHRINKNDLTRHALIVGSTGSGKTNSTLNLLSQLTKRGIPFLVIEPVKGEYAKHFKNDDNIRKFDLRSPWFVGGEKKGQCNPWFLRFNPLVVPNGITVAQHISFIKSCICAAFPTNMAMPMILELCLRDVYKNFGLFHKGTEDKTSPTLVDLEKQIERYIDDVKHEETKKGLRDMFQRRFSNFLGGVLGYALTPEKWRNEDDTENSTIEKMGKEFAYPLEVILSKPTIIDLEALSDNDEKSLVMAFLLTLLYEHRIAEGESRELKHVTVVEEAHRLLSSMNLTSHSGTEGANQSDDSKTKAIKLFMDMLAEIRAYGEGIVIIEQIPTKLISDVIKNTNLKIMHRITSSDDRQYLGEAMNFDESQKRFVSSLRQGEAVVFEEQLDHPILVRVDQRKS